MSLFALPALTIQGLTRDSQCCSCFGTNCVCCSTNVNSNAKSQFVTDNSTHNTTTIGASPQQAGTLHRLVGPKADTEIVYDDDHLRTKNCCEKVFYCCYGKALHKTTTEGVYQGIFRSGFTAEEAQVATTLKGIDLVAKQRDARPTTVRDIQELDKAFQEVQKVHGALRIVIGTIKEMQNPQKRAAVESAGQQAAEVTLASPVSPQRRVQKNIFTPMPSGIGSRESHVVEIHDITPKVALSEERKLVAAQPSVSPRAATVQTPALGVTSSVYDHFAQAAAKQSGLQQQDLAQIATKFTNLNNSQTNQPKSLVELVAETQANFQLYANEASSLLRLAQNVSLLMGSSQATVGFSKAADYADLFARLAS